MVVFGAFVVLFVFVVILFSTILKLAQDVRDLQFSREQHSDILRVLARRSEPARRAPTAEPF
jgi:predicted Holliday junction resolvase-like endonuclease